MGFIDKLKNILKPNNNSNLLEIYLRDNKCQKDIKLLVRKSYDIYRVYEDDDSADFRLNKVVICNNCYNKINLTIDFDKRYNIINTDIQGGEMVLKEDL
ncbi:MAG: hypothetical protein ACOCRK_03925 [bacterium]